MRFPRSGKTLWEGVGGVDSKFENNTIAVNPFQETNDNTFKDRKTESPHLLLRNRAK